MASHSPNSEAIISTFFVTNIHCPSCVSHAEDVLSTFSTAISRIDTSIVGHTIRIEHSGHITDRLLRELIQAAFEVEHVTVTDTMGNVLRELDVDHDPQQSSKGFLSTLWMSKAQKQHIQNCNACQEQRGKTVRPYTSWRNGLHFKRAREDSNYTDVERGILDDESQPPSVPRQHESRRNGDMDRLYDATYSIEGMTCASCTAAITTELQQHDYVQSVNVNLLANSAYVSFRGTQATAHDIKELIDGIGYVAELDKFQVLEQASVPSDAYKTSLSIEGMTCGSCVGAITQALQELQFVKNVQVDLVGNSACVEYDGQQNLGSILDTISDLGYDAHVVKAEPVNALKSPDLITERNVEIQVTGMYCPKCPQKLLTTIQQAFADAVTVLRQPTSKDARITVSYRPSVPDFTIRQIVAVLNDIDPAWSASVYFAPTLEQRSQAIRAKDRNRILRHLLVTLLVAIPSFIVGVVYMSLVPTNNATRQWFEAPVWSGTAMRIDWALFVMTTPVMFYGAAMFHTRALKEIWTLWKPRSRIPVLRRFYRFGSMNLLISVGTSVAYFSSLAVLVMDATTTNRNPGMHHKSSTYFDTVTFLTLFILFGRFLEAFSKAKAGDAISLLAGLRPSKALLLELEKRDSAAESKMAVKSVSVDMLEVGDIISIPHGACPPTDGLITQEGNFVFDESMLTGESRPSTKSLDDKVFSGTLNVGDPVRMKVSEVGGKSMLDEIVNAVREGQSKRAPIERFADTLTGYFTPVITFIGISTWIVWLVLGESGALPKGWLDVDKGSWAYWSVEFAVAVFVVACPCGIGLAAPTALSVGGGLAAKSGMIVQGGGEAFQEASRIDTIVFDKTGTLTEGCMQVIETTYLSNDDIDVQLAMSIARMLEESSTHPIARAVIRFCDQNQTENQPVILSVLGISEIPGEGMSGKFEVRHGSGTRIYEAIIGNERLLANINSYSPQTTSDEKVTRVSSRKPIPNTLLATTLSRFQIQGSSTAILAIRQYHKADNSACPYSPIAVFAISDPIRTEAPGVLAALRSRGLDVHMCTGDNQQTAQSVASQLSIPASHVRSGVLPKGKADYINELQNPASSMRKIVAFVGDGTNDTPALTMADVSIAIAHPNGGGSDIAMTSSSFILLNSDLNSIVSLIKLSKRVFLRVKLNFMWAAIYNICLIPIAAGIFFPIGATWGDNAHGGFRLNPVWASIAMAGSSVSVVLSSLALRLPELKISWFRRMSRKAPSE